MGEREAAIYRLDQLSIHTFTLMSVSLAWYMDNMIQKLRDCDFIIGYEDYAWTELLFITNSSEAIKAIKTR